MVGRCLVVVFWHRLLSLTRIVMAIDEHTMAITDIVMLTISNTNCSVVMMSLSCVVGECLDPLDLFHQVVNDFFRIPLADIFLWFFTQYRKKF